MIAIAAALISVLAALGDLPETWRESVSEDSAILSLGEPAAAAIRMRCVRPGMPRIDLASLYTGEGPQPRRVVVAGSTGRASDPLSNGADDSGRFSTDISVAAPVMLSFGRSGQLRFRAKSAHLSSGAARRPELQAISAFLRRCRGLRMSGRDREVVTRSPAGLGVRPHA
jgi:hypothetical protein